MSDSPRREALRQTLDEIRSFKFCAPWDDPEEIWAVTVGFRSLVSQFKSLASPILPEHLAIKIAKMQVDDIDSALEIQAEIDVLRIDIEEILASLGDEAHSAFHSAICFVDLQLIDRLANAENATFSGTFLSRVCREINSSYSHRNIVAVALLVRAVLNHVPPVFGHKNFSQVVASRGRSLKDAFNHLEEGLRKVADIHTHKQIGQDDSYPTPNQVEPYKPQFEILLHQVLQVLEKPDSDAHPSTKSD